MAEINSNFLSKNNTASNRKFLHIEAVAPASTRGQATLEEIIWISIADSSLGLCPKMKNHFSLFDNNEHLDCVVLNYWLSWIKVYLFESVLLKSRKQCFFILWRW